jgi:hypothetical protein
LCASVPAECGSIKRASAGPRCAETGETSCLFDGLPADQFVEIARPAISGALFDDEREIAHVEYAEPAIPGNVLQ